MRQVLPRLCRCPDHRRGVCDLTTQYLVACTLVDTARLPKRNIAPVHRVDARTSAIQFKHLNRRWNNSSKNLRMACLLRGDLGR